MSEQQPVSGSTETPEGTGQSEPKKSLVSPLLSGRSLQPLQKKSTWAKIGEHRGIAGGVAVVILLAAIVVGAKLFAERSADSYTTRRSAEIRALLREATPQDFLAFNSGVKVPGSLASQIRHEDGFVNIKAVAESSTIRFQPDGWWSGFTERCIVAVVTDSGVTVSVPKTACVRVG